MFIMKTIYYTVAIIKRRPALLWLMAMAVFVYLIFARYNPVMPIILGLGKVTGGTVSESIISFLQISIDPEIFPYILAALLGLSIIGSVLLGIFISGYFNVLYNALIAEPRKKGEFYSGVRIYGGKIILATFRVILFGLALMIFMAISSIPAIVISKLASEGRTGFGTPSILIGILTALTLYFLFMYFRVYISYWYPAIIQGAKKPFLTSRKLVNKHFWRFVFSFLLFDAILVGVNFLLGKVPNATLVFIAKLIFYTFLILLYVSYIFYTYEIFRKEYTK
ncbi:MAG TPA: hypothetical protein GXX20_03630 [Clostridiaceae bacterium]|nr:hypothetical protein [Clostridiaceae bacterium]